MPKRTTKKRTPTRQYGVFVGFAIDLDVTAPNQKAAETQAQKTLAKITRLLAKEYNVPQKRVTAMIDRKHTFRIEE